MAQALSDEAELSVAGVEPVSYTHLEVDGKKVAVVQSYTAKSSRTSQTVEAFGEDEPVATIPGQRDVYKRQE